MLPLSHVDLGVLLGGGCLAGCSGIALRQAAGPSSGWQISSVVTSWTLPGGCVMGLRQDCGSCCGSRPLRLGWRRPWLTAPLAGALQEALVSCGWQRCELWVCWADAAFMPLKQCRTGQGGPPGSLLVRVAGVCSAHLVVEVSTGWLDAA